MSNPDGSRVRWLVKGLKVTARVLVGLGLVAALITIFREQFPWTVAEAGADERTGRVLLTVATLAAFSAAFGFWVFRPRPVWRNALCLLVAVMCGWSWLAWDDPKLEYPPEDYLTVSDDPVSQETHALVLRYRNGANSTLPKDLPVLIEPASRKVGEQPTAEQWQVFLTDNRADIERGWAMLADRRAWIAEMAAAPRLADLTASLQDPLPSLKDLREVSRFMSWHARLLAMDGRGDEAMAEIGQLLNVAQKLTPESRTLVRGMVAIVMRRLAMVTATYIVDTTEVSPEARAHFASILSQREPAATGAYNLIWCEYAIAAQTILTMESYTSLGSGVNQGLNNPRATANLLANWHANGAEKSSRRELTDISAMSPPWGDGADLFKLKNIGGRLLLVLMLPGFQKVSAEYWKVEDLSVALEKRLRAVD